MTFTCLCLAFFFFLFVMVAPFFPFILSVLGTNNIIHTIYTNLCRAPMHAKKQTLASPAKRKKHVDSEKMLQQSREEEGEKKRKKRKSVCLSPSLPCVDLLFVSESTASVQQCCNKETSTNTRKRKKQNAGLRNLRKAPAFNVLSHLLIGRVRLLTTTTLYDCCCVRWKKERKK